MKFIFLLILILFSNCKKKQFSDVNECDTIGNYYENKEHFIKREFVNDDGEVDYKKLFQKYKGKETICNPLKD